MLERLEDALLDRQQSLVLGRGLVRGGHEREHLDLVELVHAEDPARVLAGGARLAPEAGREAGVAAGAASPASRISPACSEASATSDVPDEIEVVVGQAVDLLLGVGQEARAVERALAHEHRRDDRLEAVLARQRLERVAHERELEHHEVALEVGEARAGQTRAPVSMSIIGPASSRWSRPVRPASPTSRTTVSCRGARGRGGSAARRARRCSSASTPALLVAQRPPARGDVGHRGDRLASSPRCSAAPIASDAAFCSARILSSPGRSSRQRASRARTRSIGPSAPRRASAARTASGSRRISLRSSTRRRRRASGARRRVRGAAAAVSTSGPSTWRRTRPRRRRPRRRRCSAA